jgi:hypothetical protein
LETILFPTFDVLSPLHVSPQFSPPWHHGEKNSVTIIVAISLQYNRRSGSRINLLRASMPIFEAYKHVSRVGMVF